MNGNKEIYFRQKVISTISDLISQFSTLDISDYNKEIADTLYFCLKSEQILMQNINYILSPLRLYGINDLLKTQSLLELLDIIETIKHRNEIVNARSLLRKFLYSQFNLDFFNYSNLMNYNVNKKKDSLIKNNTLIMPNEKLSFGNCSIKFNSYDLHNRDSKTIRNYFESYLYYRSSNPDDYYFFYQVIQSKQRADSKKAQRDYQPHYYLPANQIPEFLLAFAFNDGRDYKFQKLKKDPRLPRFSKKMNRSEDAYKRVLFTIQEHYPNSDTNSVDDIIHRYRLNQMFLSGKLNRLYEYYKLYTSDGFLTQIIETFTFSYNEILSLKQVIINNIFMDTIFIRNILSSPFLDGFLFFDVMYQSRIYLMSNASNNLSHNNFLCIIKQCKEETSSFIHTPPWILAHYIDNINKQIFQFQNVNPKPIYNSIDLLTFSPEGALDITKSEEFIIKELLKNPFYKNYFIEKISIFTDFYDNTTSFIDTYLKSSVDSIIPFDKIRSLLAK